MKSIMHLVNSESILVESMELARHGLASQLNVGVEYVQLTVRVDEQGTIKPEFSVSGDVVGKFTEDGIRKKMAFVWMPLKRQMQQRLNGLKVRR